MNKHQCQQYIFNIIYDCEIWYQNNSTLLAINDTNLLNYMYYTVLNPFCDSQLFTV